MAHRLYQLDEHNNFPCVSKALTEPNGLLAIGGDLSTTRLIEAYRCGVFPWFSEGDPLLWWSPNPRAVIYLNDLRINRTLKKAINKSSYKVTLNTAFEEVIEQCADAPFRNDDTWIVSSMQSAYINLHHAGFAHSIEVWEDDKLIGGLYGVAVNGFFSGESMFYAKDNGSKFALIALKLHLEKLGVTCIDCQLLNPFLSDMGAIEIPRKTFLDLKLHAINIAPPIDFWQPKRLCIK